MKFSTFLRYSFLFLYIAILLIACGGSRQYTQEDLEKLNTKKVQGTIVKNARGYFVMKGESGKEDIYRTGRVTQYIPTNYIPLEGDLVKTSIQEVWKYLDRPVVDKRVVYQVEALQLAEKNKPLSNPIKGIIKGFGPESRGYSRSLLIDISEDSPLIMHVSSWATKVHVYGKSTLAENIIWSASVDKEVEVIAKREAVRRQSGYIYVAEKISFLNAETQHE